MLFLEIMFWCGWLRSILTSTQNEYYKSVNLKIRFALSQELAWELGFQGIYVFACICDWAYVCGFVQEHIFSIYCFSHWYS